MTSREFLLASSNSSCYMFVLRDVKGVEGRSPINGYCNDSNDNAFYALYSYCVFLSHPPGFLIISL